MQRHALGGRHAVGGELHDKGNRISLELCAFQHKGSENAAEDAKKVQPNHHIRGVLWEKGGREHAVDGKLGAARHKGDQHDGHVSIPLGRKRACGQNGRHRAAKAQQHGHKAAPRKADAPQRFIHDKGDARHIAAIL